MKKLVIILAIVSFCVINISCGTPKHNYDNSLTGSISYEYMAEIEGVFDGVPVSANDSFADSYICTIRKISNKTVSFYCNLQWLFEDEEWKTWSIYIPEILVSGKPYDVAFDYTSLYASVFHDEKKYEPVSVSIFGWMRDTGRFQYSTRKSQIVVEYDCDIIITCIIDGKELELKISKLTGIA